MDARCLIFAVIMGVAWAQSDPSVSDVLSKLPEEYQGKINETQFNEIKNKSIEVFQEKCEKNGGPDIFPSVKKAYEAFPSCVKESLGVTDPSILQKEIEQAKPNGTVDEVFKKYCAKTPQVKECLKNTLDAVKPCFTAEEQKNLKIIYNITEQLAGFICYKDGDRIALFIAEGGPECYQEKMEEIQDCMNNTYGAEYKFNSTDITANSIPEITFGEKECRQLNELQKCIVNVLEKCKTPASANIVESLFKFARKATPCSDPSDVVEPKPRSNRNDTKPGSASGLSMTTATLAFSAAMTLFL